MRTVSKSCRCEMHNEAKVKAMRRCVYVWCGREYLSKRMPSKGVQYLYKAWMKMLSAIHSHLSRKVCATQKPVRVSLSLTLLARGFHAKPLASLGINFCSTFAGETQLPKRRKKFHWWVSIHSSSWQFTLCDIYTLSFAVIILLLKYFKSCGVFLLFL